ncbi:MAG: hypothetical protein K2J80_02475 [Oscillospiraceae bacterium]|nr:hypothetical protein [Oscillospiraceae bacterium]
MAALTLVDVMSVAADGCGTHDWSSESATVNITKGHTHYSSHNLTQK